MEPQIQYAKTSDGVNIAYATEGEGPPLVLLPIPMVSHVGAAVRQVFWSRPDAFR